MLYAAQERGLGIVHGREMRIRQVETMAEYFGNTG